MTSWFGIVYTFHKTFRGLLSVSYTKSSYTSIIFQKLNIFLKETKRQM